MNNIVCLIFKVIVAAEAIGTLTTSVKITIQIVAIVEVVVVVFVVSLSYSIVYQLFDVTFVQAVVKVVIVGEAPIVVVHLLVAIAVVVVHLTSI
jgi:hypothetical protein